MRYLPLSDDDRQAMLARIGARTIDDLFRDVPRAALLTEPVDLPLHRSEMDVERLIRSYADANLAAGAVPFFCGAGAYRHHVPASVDHIIQRGEFLTSYTPYQAEIAQGTLQYLFEFQTQVARLFAMDVANASLYDGSTACLEAILMALRITRRRKAVLSGGLHAHYIDVARSMTAFMKEAVIAGTPALTPQRPGDDTDWLVAQIDEQTACVVVQYPNMFGHAGDLTALAEAAHAKGALLVVVVTEPVAMGALKAPGEMGADIVAGEGQAIGNGLNFGGPYLGLFATREKFLRQMPGRLCGETVDQDGKRGYVLTLSAREQHIRREKATSNICTNSGLCALAFTIHMTLLGEAGLRRLAMLNHMKAVQLAERLDALHGVSVLNDCFFNEFTVRVADKARAVTRALAERRILGGVPLARLYPNRPELDALMLVAVTETVSADDMDALVDALQEIVA
ncbi:MAG: aminomethyl-transferring glycine dehydrogenase subunit GcvPA [Alphaproteobacteria bacterium]|nr:MAG: aminomethyl-transferring glycine dehydrogenase subunit GcvPA [Alphaproteobacteria bacterium]